MTVWIILLIWILSAIPIFIYCFYLDWKEGKEVDVTIGDLLMAIMFFVLGPISNILLLAYLFDQKDLGNHVVWTIGKKRND